MKPQIYRSGDCAITIEFGKEISPAVNGRVLAFERALAAENIAGITETVPAYTSLLICYNPGVISYSELCRRAESLFGRLCTLETTSARLWEIPCCYGMYFGKDIDSVCRHSGLSEKEVIALHSETEYRIYMLGFLPGFVYLGALNPILETPRLKIPRKAIPRGSVGIGGKQTGIYPFVSPGGWNLIGCTPLDMYMPQKSEPVPFSAGDFIRFTKISADDFYRIRRDVMRSSYFPDYSVRRADI